MHACVLGIGERTGNTPLEMLLLNQEANNPMDCRDTTRLLELCQLVAESTACSPRWGHPLYAHPDKLVEPDGLKVSACDQYSWSQNEAEPQHSRTLTAV